MRDTFKHTDLHKIHTLKCEQNGRYFADDILKCIFLGENCCIPIQMSWSFVHKGLLYNASALVDVIVWHRTGHKQFSEQAFIEFHDAMLCNKVTMS